MQERNGEAIRYVWERCGHPLRAGQSQWQAFEILANSVQLQMLEAAATAIELIESQILNAAGEFAGLFGQEPQREFTNGLPVHVGSEECVNYWRKAAKAIEEAVLDARHNPETARSLFRLASYGRNDPASSEQLRAIFSKEQIPAEFLTGDHVYWIHARIEGGRVPNDAFATGCLSTGRCRPQAPL